MPHEVPPPHTPIWRDDAQRFSAIPVCRTCAAKYELDVLCPFPTEHSCNIVKCENASAYLAIQ